MITTESEKNLNEVDLDQVSGGTVSSDPKTHKLSITCDVCGGKIIADGHDGGSTLVFHKGELRHICKYCRKKFKHLFGDEAEELPWKPKKIH